MGPHIRQFTKSNLSFFAISVFSLLSLLPGAAGSVAHAQSPREPVTAVLLRFSKPMPEKFWQTLQEELDRLEIPSLMRESPFWLKQEEFHQGMEFSEIVQVQLRGDCSSGEQSARRVTPGPLGWVSLVDGQIQPFVFVDCDRITQALAVELRGKTMGERHEKLARAISRVIEHELIHIATQDAGHREQKPYLSPAELVEGLRQYGRNRAPRHTYALLKTEAD